MFVDCRNKIIDCLIASGAIKNKIYTSQKKLKASNESRIFAVLFENDELEKNKSKRIYIDDAGRHKRRKQFNRELSFSVVIGEYSVDKVQEIYDRLLSELPDGIYVDGNYVEIVPVDADWMDDEDTILKAKCAVQLKITCKGGVYKDTDFKQISEVDFSVQKENTDGT